MVCITTAPQTTGVLVHTIILALADVVCALALSVVMSSYERRCMSLLHNRDAPVAYLLMGLGQPVADGAKLVLKGVHTGIMCGVT